MAGAVLTVDQAIEFALGEDDRTGNLLFATDHLVDGETIANYVHAGAFAGNLTGLDCYAANVIPDSIMNTLADAALIRAEVRSVCLDSSRCMKSMMRSTWSLMVRRC